jgi:curved DNA-binding protein CbpA
MMTPDQTVKNYYKILGVAHTASMSDIRKAYTDRVKQCHPDRLQNEAADVQRKAEQLTRLLNDAKTILLDIDKRQAYDEQIQLFKKAERPRPTAAKPRHTVTYITVPRKQGYPFAAMDVFYKSNPETGEVRFSLKNFFRKNPACEARIAINGEGWTPFGSQEEFVKVFRTHSAIVRMQARYGSELSRVFTKPVIVTTLAEATRERERLNEKQMLKRIFAAFAIALLMLGLFTFFKSEPEIQQPPSVIYATPNAATPPTHDKTQH